MLKRLLSLGRGKTAYIISPCSVKVEPTKETVLERNAQEEHTRNN